MLENLYLQLDGHFEGNDKFPAPALLGMPHPGLWSNLKDNFQGFLPFLFDDLIPQVLVPDILKPRVFLRDWPDVHPLFPHFHILI